MAEVFISYSQKERALAAPVAARLTELGVEVWYDPQVPSGKSFSTFIHENLREAKAVLTCWSPEAIKSDWVRSEADYAREQGTYLPIFVVPCKLLPPFNHIQTEDLSNWQGEMNDPTWIKVVDRIAELVGREGVAAAARALAGGDEKARYEFAQRHPDEPTAHKIWNAAEAAHREHFERGMAEARAIAEGWIQSDHEALNTTLAEASSGFDTWLVNERRNPANAPMPDPLKFIEGARLREEQRLRKEVFALQNALAQMRTKNIELENAKAEITRLTKELAFAFEKVKARDGDSESSRSEFVLRAAALNFLTAAGRQHIISMTDAGPPPSRETIAEIKVQLRRIQRNSLIFYISTIVSIVLIMFLAVFFQHK
jgi:hypothetical protein